MKENKYHQIRVELEHAKTEKDLLKIVEDTMRNTKKYNLDESDLLRLEQIGMKRLEQIQRDRSFLIRNKKQGFNNFD